MVNTISIDIHNYNTQVKKYIHAATKYIKKQIFFYLIFRQKKKGCVICKSKVRTWCESFSIGLCMNCFITFYNMGNEIKHQSVFGFFFYFRIYRHDTASRSCLTIASFPSLHILKIICKQLQRKE